MKRRSLLWFAASAILALLAGVLAVVFIRGLEEPAEQAQQQQMVAVASVPIGAGDAIRADYVKLDGRNLDEIPTGVVLELGAIQGAIPLRDISAGEILVIQMFRGATTGSMRDEMPADKIAVALPANDILSKWGVILPEDHVDILFTMDVILETPMYIDDIRTAEEATLYSTIVRDQSMDNVSVLTLQNAKVLDIVEEPPPVVNGEQQETAQPLQRALILQVDPQDAVVLKYLRNSGGSIQLALRSTDNDALFTVQPVNINYLMLRYGIVLPQPLE